MHESSYATYGVERKGPPSYGARVAPRTRTLAERLARSLSKERQRRGWTQEQAAEATAIHARHYQKLEEGSVNATLRTLERLCHAFDVDVGELFKR